MSSPTSHHAVAVAVDGIPADHAVLTWAAEEADRTGRSLLLAYAAGHLPPTMTYAERHGARAERVARGEQLLEAAVRCVHLLAPGVAVSTAVRLLDRDALLPVISGQATVLAGVSRGWHLSGRRSLLPATAAVTDATADAHVVHFATDYAAHRGVALKILEHSGERPLQRLLDGAHDTSLLALPRPEPGARDPGFDWSTVLGIVRSLRCPVVLVSPTPHGS